MDCFLCGSSLEGRKSENCGAEGCNAKACSLHCLKLHQDEKNNLCRPFASRQNEQVGRFLVATRKILALEVVLIDPPILMAPQSLPVCLVCLGPLPNEPKSWEQCQGCHFPMCSKQCGDIHPCQFQEECELLTKVAFSLTDVEVNKPNLLYSTVGVLRLLLLKNEPPFDNQWISQMMDHKEDLAKDPVMTNHIHAMSKVLLEEMELASRFTHEDVVHAFGVLRINVFGVTSPSGGSGRGLFPLLALMSHSCQSNLQHEQSKQTSSMVLTAQRTIEAGEELTIRYIDTIQAGLAERQHLLQDQWYFKCGCKRCKDPTDCGTWSNSISCINCANPRLTPIVEEKSTSVEVQLWQCQNCQAQLEQAEAEAIIEACKNKWSQTLELSLASGDLSISYNLLKEIQANPLSRWNTETLKMSFALARLYCQELGGKSSSSTSTPMEVLQNWKSLCEEILQALSMIDPGSTKLIATFLLHHNRVKLTLDKAHFDQGLLPRADYLHSIKQAVILENRACKVLEKIN